MCTQQRYIYNRYTHSKVLVPCGRCESCQQAKANKAANRIRNNVTSGQIALFVTLTYSNNYVPYLKRSDLFSDDFEVNVFRDSSCRMTFSRSHGYDFRHEDGTNIIHRLYLPLENRMDDAVTLLPSLSGKGNDKVGVCLYSDFQKFIKRLRVILQRNYNCYEKFTYFGCSEYGSYTKRPHFHALVFIPRDCEAIFRTAIVKAWPYADSHRTEKFIEVAKDCATYVASYVTKYDSVLSCLQGSEFEAKHTYSKFFGVVLDCFSLSEILSKIDRRDLYYYSNKRLVGETSFVPLPIPEYVINRYFPKFKGHGWLAPSQLYELLIQPSKIGDWFGDKEIMLPLSCCDVVSCKRSRFVSPCYDFSPKETYQIYVRLENSYQYFHERTGLGRYDYAYYYINAWQQHKSNVIKDSFKDIESVEQLSSFYSNANELRFGEVTSDLLTLGLQFEFDPNKVEDTVSRSLMLRDLFHKLTKEKQIVNYAMSNLGYAV